MLRNLRAAHEREGRLPMALAAVDRLLHLEPLDVSTLKDRAILLARLSRPAAAARALSRAVALLPEGAEREALARIRSRLLRDAAARN
jgi:regulator of sirC expression with transglutaminase-like and TPR domain